MKIDRITYSESIEVSSMPGKWVKVGIEAEVLPDEHASDCLDAARSFIKTWMLNNEPPVANPNWDHKPVEKPSYDTIVLEYGKAVNECISIEELKKYERFINYDPHKQSFYDQKLKSLLEK